MILFTGITGKAGKVLLKKLENDSHFKDKKYRALLRKTSDITPIKQSKLNIERCYGSLEDQAFLDKVMIGVDIVFHIAGIRNSVNIIKSALLNQVKWIICVHTTGIYSKFKSASSLYLDIEEEISCLMKQSVIPLTILRPTMIYGSLQDKNMAVFIKMVDKLKVFPIINNGKYLLQPIHEKDLAHAYMQVLNHEEKTKGKEYILSGHSPIFLIDIFKTIETFLGKKNIYIPIPFFIAYLGAVFIYIFSLRKRDYREMVQRLTESRAFGHENAKNDFNFSPMSFEKGIELEIKEYLKEKKS